MNDFFTELFEGKTIKSSPDIWFEKIVLYRDTEKEPVRTISLKRGLNVIQAGVDSVHDEISGIDWPQLPCPDGVAVGNINQCDNEITYELNIPGGAGTLSARLYFDKKGCGGALLSLSGDFSFDGEISYPGAFDVKCGDVALLPVHEGYAFAVDDPSAILPERRPGYSGWWHSMQFWAIQRDDHWILTHMEDSLDTVVRESRGPDGLVRSQLSWVPQLGKWGPGRTLRFIAGGGGMVGAMKWYRGLMKEKNLLATLREKKIKAPNIDKIIGAANMWLWGADDIPAVTGEMLARGMDKVLWSHLESKQNVAYLRDKTGYLVGRYDIYRDIPTPEIAARQDHSVPDEERGSGNHADAWPDDVVIDKDGERLKCWVVRYADGTRLAMECMCGLTYLKHAMRDVTRDARNKGYEARFVDTVTAAEFVECYHPLHPATRETEGKWRLKTTEWLCDLGLVTGIEDMMDIAVPYAHYTEGLMSVGLFRQPEAGYDVSNQFYGGDVDPVIRGYQLNPAYRAPLWELVFHDCVINYWYWGDSSSTYPELTPLRDLFNALYGTLPMYSIKAKDWDAVKETVFESYPRATRVARLTGYDEMTDFIYLTPDKLVQRTVFANGVTVTANFSDRPFACEDGVTVNPCDYRMVGP